MKRLGVVLVALAVAVVSPSTVQASAQVSASSSTSSADGFEAGRDFIKAAVFGVGPMTDEVSDALGDPEFDAFLASRVDTRASNARLDAFLDFYAKQHPGLIERVGSASRSGNPYVLDVSTAAFLEQVEPVSAQLAKAAKKRVRGDVVTPSDAHTMAVVPIAVALAAYMYAAAAHTAGVAVQVGAGFAYFVYNKVKFWGASEGSASEIEHEDLVLRLAEGLKG